MEWISAFVTIYWQSQALNPEFPDGKNRLKVYNLYKNNQSMPPGVAIIGRCPTGRLSSPTSSSNQPWRHVDRGGSGRGYTPRRSVQPILHHQIQGLIDLELLKSQSFFVKFHLASLLIIYITFFQLVSDKSLDLGMFFFFFFFSNSAVCNCMDAVRRD